MSSRILGPFLAAAVLFATPLLAQVGGEEPRAGHPSATPSRTAPVAPDRNARRLFERFIEDAAVTPGGFIEGRYVYQNLNDGASHFVGPLIAFKVVKDLEAGITFGFLDRHPDSGPQNSGLSALDMYAKYRLPGSGPGRFALGTRIKSPTSDEGSKFGTGRSDVELFGAFRADLEAVTLVASLGARHNGDPGPSLPAGKDSLLIGAGILMPASPRFTLSLEGTWESKRIEGAKSDARLTVGVQTFGPDLRGGFRGAVAFPLNDGAPDLGVILGAFYTY